MGLWQLLRTLWERPERSPSERAPGGLASSDGGGVAVTEAEGSAPTDGDSADRWWSPLADALVKMPNPEPPPLSTEAIALDHLLDGFCEREDLRLPSLPKVAERALRLMESDKSDARAIARALEEDPVIAAAVLRLANCSLYAGMEHVQNLHVAVARLGRNALNMVLFQHSLAAATSRGKRRGDPLATFVWSGSLSSACIMREMAALTLTDPEEAYLSGLLHDIGNVLVLLEAQEQEALLHCHIDLDAFIWLCRKHHQRLGQLIASAWSLPASLQSLVGDHHQSLNGGATPAEREIAMLVLTDMIKSMLGYLPPVAFNLPDSKPAKILGLAGSPSLAKLLDELPEQLREIAAPL